ncbi:MFS transporter [Allorhodopirellula heiligendammensis]|uniref:Major Facilitator Superfamily protein n=1 Tax=Allorhodopirellula heiligendammensis TaxID=2714739 RepID=A0A5C6BYA8_9BACT|nr:MFS transporter [Allorhodopirellula heiligendammensis]TWU16256.1 Major Facilitator Superfamily protein [Allorhodopirellula heiligendammensis]
MNYLSNGLSRRLPFFYGYVMLPIAMLMQIGTSPGQTFAVSAFTPALLASLELSESRLALAYMLGTFLAAAPLSMVGPFSDRFGLRLTSLIVVALLSGACYFASTVTGFATLLLAFFLLRFLGQGSLTLLNQNTTAMWFRSRIGRVSAILSIGTAAAFAWVPQMLSEAIQDHGWRSTYQVMAVLVAVILLPLIALLYRNKPEEIGQMLDGMTTKERHASHLAPTATSDDPAMTLADAGRTATFYILAAISAVWAMIGTGIVFYLFTLCEDRGLQSSTATALFKTFGLSMLAMQFVGSVATDYLRLDRLLGLGAVLLCVGLALIWFAQTSLLMHGFAICFGGGQGLLMAVTGVVWVRYYGRKHLGSIRGSVWCATVAGSGLGPLVMGAVKDATASYDTALLMFLLLLTPLAIAAWFVRPPVTHTHPV